MPRRTLKLAVFVSGLSVMSVEMAASRLLAPWFGTALTVWTALIGIVMVALTAGYWLGGRLADRHPRVEYFFRILLGSGLLILVTPFVSDPILAMTAGAGGIGVVAGSFLGVALLFAVPLGMLGMVSPFAIRLVTTDREHAGEAAGGIYALSTAGSILGTFLPGFVLIPFLGTQATILACGALLVAVACLGLGSRVAAVTAVGTGLFLATFLGPMKQLRGLVHQQESLYNYIQVVRREVAGSPGRARNLLVLNEGRAVHSIHDPDSPTAPFVGAVWDYMNVPLVLAGEREGPQRATVIGLAAGTVPHQWIHFFGDAWDLRVDGAEIDPDILEVGREYFTVGADEATGRLDAHAEDGRMFLRRQEPGSYDVILTDAYKQPYIPFHLATLEYFELVHSRLREGGVMAINVGVTDRSSELFRRLLSTVGAVFGEVRYVLVRNAGVPFDNHVVLAGKGEVDWSRLDPDGNAAITEVAREAGHPGFRTLFSIASRNLRRFEDQDPELVLTDDRAPVELYTEKMIFDYLSAGGGIPST